MFLDMYKKAIAVLLKKPISGPVIAVIKSYSYAFVPYILMTKPEITATQALRFSMKMTEGKKAQMFLADLCVYGGLAVVTFVISLFALIPHYRYSLRYGSGVNHHRGSALPLDFRRTLPRRFLQKPCPYHGRIGAS